MWELDIEKLLALIHAAEGELLARTAMKMAADDLLAVKIHRLGWPDPCQ
jgi:hypothetical protein